MRLLIPLLLLLPAMPSFAQVRSEAPCTPPEVVLWSCSARSRLYALCASPNLGSGTGHLQYRAGPLGKPELLYPSEPLSPKGRFHYSLLAKGARLSFTHDGYRYDIYEPLQGHTTISVSQGRAPAKLAVTCGTASDTLTLTPTLELFKSIGIYEE